MDLDGLVDDLLALFEGCRRRNLEDMDIYRSWEICLHGDSIQCMKDTLCF